MKAVLISLLGALCLAQENVHVPITREPRGWQLDVRVDNSRRSVPAVLEFDRFTKLTTITARRRSSQVHHRVAFSPATPYTGPPITLRILDDLHETPFPVLGIGVGSSLVEQMEPIAVIKNGDVSTSGNLLLRSTFESFANSCVPGSIMSRLVGSNRVVLKTSLDGQVQLSLLSEPVPLVFRGTNFVLSVPERSFGQFVDKMVDLGALRISVTDEGNPSQNSSGVLMGNCSSDLVSLLPSIRIEYAYGDVGFLDIAPDDFITMDESSQTCKLSLVSISNDSVILNPLLLPYFNFRIIHGGSVIEMCDAREIGVEYDTGIAVPEQVVTTSFNLPITFDELGAHLNVLFDSQFNVDMILHGGNQTAVRTLPSELSCRTRATTQSEVAPPMSFGSVFVPLARIEEGIHEDRLAIGHGSALFDHSRAVAILRNSLIGALGNFVWRSTPESFAASCVPNTIISKRVSRRIGLESCIRFNSIHNIGYVQFVFGHDSGSSGIVATVPSSLIYAISEKLRDLGAIESERILIGGNYVQVMDNCSPELVQGFPPLTFRVLSTNGARITISPTEYIRVDHTGRTCHLLVVDNESSGSQFSVSTVYPLRIPSWNTRYASDGDIRVCKTALASPLPSHGSVLNIATRTVPVMNQDHVEAETRGNFFRRFLRTARCAFRALGCRSR